MKEREFEGEERETREEGEKVRNGAGSLVFTFLAGPRMLECMGPRLRVAGFQILPFTILGAP